MRTERENSARRYLRFARCCLVGYDQHQILDVQFGEGRTRERNSGGGEIVSPLAQSKMGLGVVNK